MKRKKPTTKDELRPPFQNIGDEGWDIWLREVLADYEEFELPTPVTSGEIAKREAKLGVSLPNSVKLVLTTFGHLQLDDWWLCSLEEMVFLDEVETDFDLTPEQNSQLRKTLRIAETFVDPELSDFYGVDCETGKIYLHSYFLGVFTEVMPSFDNLFKMYIMYLSFGIYGGDSDDSISEKVDEIIKDELGWIKFEL